MNKSKHIYLSVFDYLFTYGGSLAIILYNYISPRNTTGFKISITGIIMLVALLLVAKWVFEKNYQEKTNQYLQELAEATDTEVKKKLSDKLNAHKTRYYIYQRVMMLLPFIIMYVMTLWTDVQLQSLKGTLGLMLMSMGVGSIFNVMKKSR